MGTLKDVPCGKTVKVRKLAGEGPVKNEKVIACLQRECYSDIYEVMKVWMQ